jgi:hypothetical protein
MKEVDMTLNSRAHEKNLECYSFSVAPCCRTRLVQEPHSSVVKLNEQGILVVNFQLTGGRIVCFAKTVSEGVVLACAEAGNE